MLTIYKLTFHNLIENQFTFYSFMKLVYIECTSTRQYHLHLQHHQIINIYEIIFSRNKIRSFFNFSLHSCCCKLFRSIEKAFYFIINGTLCVQAVNGDVQSAQLSSALFGHLNTRLVQRPECYGASNAYKGTLLRLCDCLLGSLSSGENMAT